jgi:sodium/potassium-transporting ATPase subunit alpha
MDDEKGEIRFNEESRSDPPAPGDHRIQFTDNVKLGRSRQEDGSTFVPPSRRSQSVGSIRRRPQSIVSLPPVIPEKEKERLKRVDEKQKHVNINEHLLPHKDVAAKYQTEINLERPGDSLGLTTAQAEQLLVEHGPNIL